MEDVKGAILFFGTMAVGVMGIVWLGVSDTKQAHEKIEACTTICNITRSKVIDDSCYCRDATGWVLPK